MTPERALDELVEQSRQRGEMYVSYSPGRQLELLVRSVRMALYDNGRIDDVWITSTGTVVIDKGFARRRYERGSL